MVHFAPQAKKFRGISDSPDPDPHLTPPCFPEKGERGGSAGSISPDGSSVLGSWLSRDTSM